MSLKHGYSGKKIYHIWQSMRARCKYKSQRGWKYYGGRGIKVCERWNSIENFAKDMGQHPGGGYSLDRIDPNGDYTPENCRWASPNRQARNKRNNRHVTLNGKTQTIADWIEELGLNNGTARSRLRRGMSVELSLSKALMGKKMLNYKGKKIHIAELARLVGVPRGTFWFRINKGWRVEDAVTVPVMSHAEAGKCNTAIRRGEDSEWSKLNSEDVTNIRRRYRKFSKADNMPSIAKDYGVGTVTIWHIIHKTTWKHL